LAKLNPPDRSAGRKIVAPHERLLGGRQQFTLKAESSLEVVLTSGQKLQYDSPATLSYRDEQVSCSSQG